MMFEDLSTLGQSKHRQMMVLIATVTFLGCAGGGAETTDELLRRYEQEGAVEFLAPVNAETGEVSGSPARDAFRFTSAEAEARFLAELGLKPTSPESGPRAFDAATNWFCYGASNHKVDTANGLVQWIFHTRNDSTRTKRQAPVWGTVYHPTGLTLNCHNNTYYSGNSCSIYTTIESGYTSSTSRHFCCEKRSFSQVCTEEFATADAL